jgi:hypothetical protein
VNKKGILFIYEALLVCVLLGLFVLAYANIDLSLDYTKTINYYKANDIFVLTISKQLSQNQIKDLVNYYLPNTEVVFDNSETTKKECYAKSLNIWKGFPASKEIIYVKICF